MALTAGSVWEVRTAGSDLNGGGFVAGAAGTDYSQQNGSNTGANDKSTTDAVTAASTTVTSATANFGTTIVGNIIYLAGGSGALTGAWYAVITRVNATTITVDRNPGVSTGVTMNIGGALATLTQVAANWVAGNKAFVKADGTYAPTATISFTVGGTPPPANMLVGYTTTRTDKGKATIQATTNTGITVLSLTGVGYWIRNFIIDCNNLGTSIGVLLGQFGRIENCTIKNFTTAGVKMNSNTTSVTDSEITAGTSAATGAIDQNAQGLGFFQRLYIHDNACPGIVGGPSSTTSGIFLDSVIANNTGASSDGVQIRSGAVVMNCSIYGNGRDGIRHGANNMYAVILRNNILVNNGGFGINLTTTPAAPALPGWDGNAYYNNTSGARNNMDNTTTSSTVNNGVSPYTNVFDVTLTGVPFTNAGANDFSLNNTTGQGAACRAAGIPGTFLGGTFISYQDMGAVQHQDSPSTTTTNIFILDD